ncbi:hypothetical protein DEU56DRAFT_534325 [Suillus clintonianus]|uniref:uncharacterized protein n=1 Tax=Suillus clintonianus TaxID=1904413 RepID=UPI001B86D83A|nr:uncharacterized protein DEU56DRAFT_534325 [Suillus clintonianus]KAG2126923.1 hypothetical protein DEU56DRAFT_534325 [Suillus clintonianus]
MSQQTKDNSTPLSHQQGQQQQFNILPHPAKSNDPADLAGGPRLNTGLTSKPEFQAYHARDPHVPSKDIVNNLEAPLSREELHRRAEELNKK